jgi:hypothetical protein
MQCCKGDAVMAASNIHLHSQICTALPSLLSLFLACRRFIPCVVTHAATVNQANELLRPRGPVAARSAHLPDMTTPRLMMSRAPLPHLCRHAPSAEAAPSWLH